MNDRIRNKLQLLAPLPGCYLMKNSNGEIIYVGKAKKLNMRVTQYFTKSHGGKTQKMVSEIEDFDTIITASEREALILEMNLVHEHNPRYNILLKDNRSYPYVQLKKGKYPYLRISRNSKDKDAKSYGPYPDSSAAYDVLNLLNRIFPLRKCRIVPNKPCLYYHIGQCLAPCINQISEEQYHKIEEDIHQFMKGNVGVIKADITKRMMEHSEALRFEQALESKSLLESIDYIISRQNVQFKDRVDRDVFAFHIRDEHIAISTLIIRNGVLLAKSTDVSPLYDEADSSFVSYIMQYYQSNPLPKEVIIPKIEDAPLLEEALDTHFVTPVRGAKLDLLQLGAQNAIKGMEEKFSLAFQLGMSNQETLDQLGNLLQSKVPYQIELIDNSHLQGENAVSAVVVFQNGEPNKKLYRRYRLQGEETKNDLASMEEVLRRRYERAISENTPLSDLLIVDGGVTQMRVAQETLKSLGIDVPVAGLAKDQKHTTKYLITPDYQTLDLKSNQPLFFLLTRMQDEVHRFAITYHRSMKVKSMTVSKLDQIPGLGEKRKQTLLKAFGTIARIQEASDEELAQYLPKNVIVNLRKWLDV